MALIVQTCSNQVTVTQPVGDYSTTVSWVSNGTSNQYMSTGGPGSTTVISGLIPGVAYSISTVGPTVDTKTTEYSKSFMIQKLCTTQCQTCPEPTEYGCSVDWIKVFFIMVFALVLFVLK